MTFGAQNGNLSRRLVCALDRAAQPGVAWSVRNGRFWAWAAAAASILGICIATLHSRGGGSTPAGWSPYLTTGDAAFAELIANLILFIPLGVALTVAGAKPMRVIAAGAVLSCTVEFLQQWIPGRDPSLGDIVANTNSTALGVLLVVAAPIWLFVPSRRSTWQALTTAIIAVPVWWGTAFMLRQTAPPLPYDVVLTPDFRYFGHYNGRVIDVRPAKTGGRLDITAIAATEPPSRTCGCAARCAASRRATLSPPPRGTTPPTSASSSTRYDAAASATRSATAGSSSTIPNHGPLGRLR